MARTGDIRYVRYGPQGLVRLPDPYFLLAFCMMLLVTAALSVSTTITVAQEWSASLAPGIVLTLCLLPFVLGVRNRFVVWLFTLMLALAMILVLVDAVYSTFYGRPINLAVDAQVLPRVIATLVTGFPKRAWIGLSLAAMLFVTFLLVARGTIECFRQLSGRVGVIASALGLAFMSVGAAAISVSLGEAPYQTRAAQTIADQVSGYRAYRGSLDGIRRDVAADPLVDGGGLAALGGANVHLIFIESYGSFLLYGEVAEETRGFLNAFGEDLSTAGFSTVSTTVTAPIIGGRSWLSHGTVLSGVTLKNDAYTPVLYDSERETLVDLFAQAGYRTVAVGPSVRRPWSENGYFRFDTVLNFWDLDYIGPSVGPLEIPDQVTLRRIEDIVVRQTDKPLFLVTPLLSSHWPWTTVPKRLPWESIDRGQGLAFMAEDLMEKEKLAAMPAPDGLPPFYLSSIRYSLQASVDYAINALGDDDLVIILGDHPPAAYVTKDRGARGVPIHVLSRNAALLERFEAAGYVGGMIPAESISPPPMAQIPRLLVE